MPTLEQQQEPVQLPRAEAAAAGGGDDDASDGVDGGGGGSAGEPCGPLWVMCDHCNKWRSLPPGHKVCGGGGAGGGGT
jgi:hypothetical protein